ncbi:2Fe-2S iron-sulfur cluster-binding protein [Burkholderia multivorans]|uniref:2Fe-2S iron-sulfur cluster-binding protein n=1 Tax=Burkholderia multivorans TaxID=87883 RepID=UPI0019CF5A05|nr:2Fe-2S iron-sulfur cluster-binding protein [Burkholderia multivorans]MBU9618572.1 2Fe-2S iron-sulfur cluster binding domain-containing protein [Burkholderia multivorans]
MYVVVDRQWRIRVSDVLDVSQLALLVYQPRTELQHLRAVLDGVAVGVGEDYASISLDWLKSECLRAGAGGGQRFARLMERLHRIGINEEGVGTIRIPIRWNEFDRTELASDGVRSGDVWQVYIVDTAERFNCHGSQHVLQAAIGARTKSIRSGCHGGGCGICKIRVLHGSYASGPMSRAHVSPAVGQGCDVLACRIYPLSNLVVELLGKSKERAQAKAVS